MTSGVQGTLCHAQYSSLRSIYVDVSVNFNSVKDSKGLGSAVEWN